MMKLLGICFFLGIGIFNFKSMLFLWVVYFIVIYWNVYRDYLGSSVWMEFVMSWGVLVLFIKGFIFLFLK